MQPLEASTMVTLADVFHATAAVTLISTAVAAPGTPFKNPVNPGLSSKEVMKIMKHIKHHKTHETTHRSHKIKHTRIRKNHEELGQEFESGRTPRLGPGRAVLQVAEPGKTRSSKGFHIFHDQSFLSFLFVSCVSG